MLRNLLSNAIKYSPQGSQVRLQLVFEQNNVIFHLSDQGIGIPSADQAKLFNAFFRGSNIGLTPGVGLGLVIVKECVDLHGGNIVVDSEVGVGTTFTVTLPLAQRLASNEDSVG
jgi:signal transduction histidine kinase